MTVQAVEGRTHVVRPSAPAVLTSEALDEVVQWYSQCPSFVLDVETVGAQRANPVCNEVLWVGLSARGRSHVIPLGHPNGDLIEIRRAVLPAGIERLRKGKGLLKSNLSKSQARIRKVFSDPPKQLPPREVFDALRPLLFDPDKTVIGHNLRFDLRSVAKYYRGEIPTTQRFDTLVAEFLTDDTLQNRLTLAHAVKRRLKYDMAKGVGKEVENFAFWEVAHYLYLDVRMDWLLYRSLTGEVTSPPLNTIMRLEMDLAEVLMSMEQRGTLIDTDELKALQTELEKELTFATAMAYRAAGGKFNLNSTVDLRRVLFSPEGRNLTPMEFTAKTGEPSTAESALKHHANDNLVRHLLSIREKQKLLGTYVVPYLGGEVTHSSAGKTTVEHRDSLLVNGRVHTSYKQHGAKTGRLSSANPNLQNIPNPEKSEYGKRIRNAFIADPGCKLVQADWSQVEPRIMASLAEDPIMIKAFLEGEDIYRAIADPLGQPRSAGKLLILAMAYGVGPDKIARSLGISMAAARQLMRDFEYKFNALARHKKAIIRAAARRRPRPYSTTVLGRRRFIPELLSRDEKEYGAGERQAYNHVIQGSAGDAMKIALIRIHRSLPDNSHLLLTVHDEVVVLAPLAEVDETAHAVKTGMEGVRLPGITVPLVAEVKIVDRWGEAK